MRCATSSIRGGGHERRRRCSRSKASRVEFPTEAGTVTAVDDLSFPIDRGETLVIVGESGSGKSVTSLAVMGLIAAARPRRRNGHPLSGQATASCATCRGLPMTTMRLIRGAEIAMIFQEPMTTLNPVYTIGEQIIEAIRFHETMSRRAARGRAEEMLELLGIPEPRAAARRLSASALGRHAPARHDRHGALLPSLAPDRRRADDGARRDRAGADPRTRSRPAERVRHGGDLHHP